jgi:hypothetical protein
LAEFWQSQLTHSESRWIGGEQGRVCDIAYQELQRIAAQWDRIRERR